MSTAPPRPIYLALLFLALLVFGSSHALPAVPEYNDTVDKEPPAIDVVCSYEDEQRTGMHCWDTDGREFTVRFETKDGVRT